VHLVVIGLENDQLKGQIARELHRASESNAIRVLDALAIQKTQDGQVVSLGASDLTLEEREEYGAIVGALLGFGATESEEGAEIGAEMGLLSFATQNFGLSQEDIQRIAADLPAGTTALMVLFEHRWAVPLKEAVMDAGGVVLAQGIIRPEDLLQFGSSLAEASAEAQPVTSQTESQPQIQ